MAGQLTPLASPLVVAGRATVHRSVPDPTTCRSVPRPDHGDFTVHLGVVGWISLNLPVVEGGDLGDNFDPPA